MMISPKIGFALDKRLFICYDSRIFYIEHGDGMK